MLTTRAIADQVADLIVRKFGIRPLDAELSARWSSAGKKRSGVSAGALRQASSITASTEKRRTTRPPTPWRANLKRNQGKYL